MKITQGHVAVVTGAGGGLGRSLAVQLAKRGCHLALVDINPQALDGTRKAIGETSLTVSLHPTDITDRAAMEKLPQEVLAIHKTVNLLINNAGITIQKSFETHSIEDWQRVININLWGTIYGCKFFQEALKAAGEAHIVNLSSMAGYIGLPGQASYSATKAAVHRLSETLWSELHDENIGVTSIHPGCIKTDMIKATLNDSDSVELAKKNYEMAQKIGVTADYAALQIIKGVVNNKKRVRIGKDAVILDIAKRLMPQAILNPMVKLVRKSKQAQLVENNA
ncbi:MAG: SDR family NAD(P)-dependent oxidoreductase [Endozoicomonas sp.]